MAAVGGAGPVTRSRIEAFDQTAAVLSSSAAQWRSKAQQLQQAADVYVDQINAPNGTQWSGDTAVSYFDTAHADRLAVLPAITHVHAMADIARRGGDQLLAAQQAALASPKPGPTTSAWARICRPPTPTPWTPRPCGPPAKPLR